MKVPEILGVVNITTDSFSDGGKFLSSTEAIAHAETLLRDGADILDLGATASNPSAEAVSAEDEIKRLMPVVAHLKNKDVRISIDSTKGEVQRWAIGEGVEFLNDIRGFPDSTMYAELAHADTNLVMMHCISDLDKAVHQPKEPREVLASVRAFFTERIATLRAAGIPDSRLIIDPGMGFFLASNPEPSLAVLASLGALKEEFALPVFIGVSRKSFLRNLGKSETCDIQTRTLAAELFAVSQGVSYIRTHEPRPLRDALVVLGAIANMVESAH